MKQTSPITTHVLDVSVGKPAKGILCTLQFQSSGKWSELSKETTDKDGRAGCLLNSKLKKGIYKLTFETGAYFKQKKIKCFYPSISITFEIDSIVEHYHVPLLLSPFGYSTYRGS